MPNAIIIGSDTWSERCRRRLDTAGWKTAVLVDAGTDADAAASADVTILALAPAERGPWLKALLRVRRTAILLRGVPGQDGSDAMALARAARKRRTRVGLLGGWRFVPLVARTCEWTEGGILGTVRRFDMTMQLPSAPAADTWFAALDVALHVSGIDVGTQPLDLRIREGAAEITYEACTLRLAAGSTGDATRQGVTYRMEADNGALDGDMPVPAAAIGEPLAAQVMRTTVNGRARSLQLPATIPADGELLVACAQLARTEAPLAVCEASRAAWVFATSCAVMQALHA